jgi:hypothetical protein
MAISQYINYIRYLQEHQRFNPNASRLLQQTRQKIQFVIWQQQRQQQLQQRVLSAAAAAAAALKKQEQTQLYNFDAVGKKALLIGINYLNTPAYQLSGCINDVSNLSNKLAFSYGYKNIYVMTDNTTIKPTRNNIYNNIKAMFQQARRGDTLFLSYSGHGSYVFDRNGDETRDRRDEVLIGSDLQSLVDDDLKGLIRTFLPPTVTLIMLCDACFSQSILDLRYQYLDTQYNTDLTDITVNAAQTATAGTVICISGCQDNQTSADAYINRTFQGALTWAFLTQLAATPRPTWKALLLGMRTLLKNRGFTQVPQLSTGKPMNINLIPSAF